MGAVPRQLVWDNEGAVGSWRRGKPNLTERVRGVPRQPGDRGAPVPAPRPGGQGPGRAGQRLPGDLVPARAHVHRPRRTSTPSWSGWLASGERAGTPAGSAAPRRRGGQPTGPRCWRCRRSPPAVGWRARVRLPRDHYVRLASNDYSVDPAVVGRIVEVVADLTHGDGHLRRDRGRPPRALLGPAPDHHRPGPPASRPGAGPPRRGPSRTVPQHASRRGRRARDLAVYDTSFGTSPAAARRWPDGHHDHDDHRPGRRQPSWPS